MAARKQLVSLEHWASNISSEERYTSQTKSDFAAPTVSPRASLEQTRKPGETTIVLGYDKSTSYSTEAQEQFTSKLGATTLHNNNLATTESVFSAKDCIHNSLHQPDRTTAESVTEQGKLDWAAGNHAAHREGLAAIEACRATSKQLNQTRIILGDSPVVYESSMGAALAGPINARAASGESLTIPRRRPLNDAPPEQQKQTTVTASLVPGRLVEIGSGGPPEPTTYETAYAAATLAPTTVSTTGFVIL